MANARPVLEAQPREERGSRASRRLRRAGLIPGIVYGGGDGDGKAFKVDARSLRAVLHESSALIDLKIGSDDPVPVIVKEQQVHPVRGDVIHVDMLAVRLDEKIHTAVPVELAGVEDAPGVRAGGILEHVTRELNIETLPTNIPEVIVVDVSDLDVSVPLHLSDVPAPEGVTFLDDPEETIIATITPPKRAAAVEEEIEEETERVGEEAEGEAAGGDEGAAESEE